MLSGPPSKQRSRLILKKKNVLLALAVFFVVTVIVILHFVPIQTSTGPCVDSCTEDKTVVFRIIKSQKGSYDKEAEKFINPCHISPASDPFGCIVNLENAPRTNLKLYIF
jgi:hypothetical protein